MRPRVGECSVITKAGKESLILCLLCFYFSGSNLYRFHQRAEHFEYLRGAAALHGVAAERVHRHESQTACDESGGAAFDIGFGFSGHDIISFLKVYVSIFCNFGYLIQKTLAEVAGIPAGILRKNVPELKKTLDFVCFFVLFVMFAYINLVCGV